MKTLSERIAERVLLTDEGRNARNRASFLMVRTEVAEALEVGYSMLAIWETLQEEGRVNFGYQAFRRYVGQLITRNATR
jgi:predicted transcriptional regulator